MNFVKLYIGDYLRDTGTLTLAQHGAYTLMLLEHYATEKPLPTGRELHRLLRADTKLEREAIDFVAFKFWSETDFGLTNQRALQEIERASHQRAINQELGKRGGRPKSTEPQTESVSETKPNSEPNRNPIQTPDYHTEKEKEKRAARGPARKRATPPKPGSVSEQVWDDWLTLRKTKRAPVTDTVLAAAGVEASKAGMSLERFLAVWCSRGSQGLQADWLKPAEKLNGSHVQDPFAGAK